MMKMKNVFLLGAVLLCALLIVPSLHPVDAKDPSIERVAPGLQKQLDEAGPNEMVTAIVKLKSVGPPPQANLGRAAVFTALRENARVSQASLKAFLNRADVAPNRGVIREFWIDNLVLVQAKKAVIDQIIRRPDVERVFDNYTFTVEPHAAVVPQPMAVQSQPWDNIAHIGAKQVWTTYGLRGAGVRVGGLDTGVDITHPDLAGKMYTTNPADPTYPGGWAEFDGNGNIIPGSVPHDSDQHGTHTSGTMIGGSASGWEIGVAPEANLMHGLVIPGGSGSFAQVAGGMEWIIDPDGIPATDDGAQVVNMSLGATGTFSDMVAPTDNMVAAGVFPSFSIGNSGPGASTTGSPGNVPSAFGVGATDPADAIASFSSRGPVTWNFPPYVGTWTKPDISAPGVSIFSSIPGGGWEGNWNGTSMAAPHVAGTVALMRQANPSMSVAEIKQILAQTAIDLGTAGMDNTYGWGRINAFEAVSAALVGVGTLNGTVTSMGMPVEGALVRVADTGQRVTTDATGAYTLRIVAGDHTIEVSRFGYESTSAVVTLVADATTTQDFSLNQLPSGTIAGAVTDAQSAMGVSASISVKLAGQVVLTSSTNPATGAYSIVLPVGTYDLSFNPTFPYPAATRTNIAVMEAMTTTLNVQLMPAEILLVDDDAGSGYETYYEQAITAAGRTYLTVSTPPTAAEMSEFGAVVWFTGNDYTTTLTAADQAALASYLDGGGRLFITGQDIGYDIATDAFYANYLHAQFQQDDVGLGAVLGNPLSPVGTGLSFAISGGTGASNQAYPSEMNPLGGAMSAFFYDPNVPGAPVTSGDVVKNGAIGGNGITGSGTAGLSYEGAYKLVYFSFGFEAIAEAADRAAVMDRVLDWLQGFPEIAHTPLGDTEDTQHPYVVKATITSDYFPLDPSSFAVVYSNGGPDMTLPMSPTGAPDEYAASIPAQSADVEISYYIRAADVEGHVSTNPIGAPLARHHFNVGSDAIGPEIVHVPLRDTNDLTGPYPVRATVTDNIGVEAVYLLYSKNGGMYHRVKMYPDPMAPEYMGAIPGPTEVGDEFDYYILAMDESYSGNVSRLPASGTFHFNIVEEFVWDFELDDGGFTQTGDVWEWGAPTSGPGAAHSGMNLWGTVLGGNYPSNGNATLDLPPITIAADRPYAVLSFWHWYNMENRYDGGNVKVSTDGGATFQVVTPARGYDDVARSGNKGIPGEPCFTNSKEYWQEDVFDLSAFAGQSVIIRFHFGSDGSVTRSGWYIDDVRLRSSDVDDVAPSIANVVVPVSSFDTAGPYAVSADVRDLFSGVAGVSLFYSLNGGMFTEVPMTHGSGDSWSASIPGQANGTRVNLYLRATDVAGNATVDPDGAPAMTHAFAILPSADILVIDYSSGGATVDDYRAALEANGHAADYWYQPSQGALTAAQMQLYKMIIMDDRSGISTTDQASLAAFLNSGTQGSKKRIFLLGRDLGYSSTTRGWISQYMRADYVQDNPNYWEITGVAGDPIGQGETFVISGSYPDEVQRSVANPGGVIVYQYTGTGTAATASYAEIQDEYAKEMKEWDGVVADAPISLDAAAGIRYNGPTYRSMYLTFNLEYIQSAGLRADILDRVIRWTASPDIDHTPLSDTENTSAPYVVSAFVYSDNLDPSRVRLTYNLGAGPDVVVTMTPTGNPHQYAASIPAQPFGTTVSYYLSAANTDGATSYHPAGAPGDKHVFNVISDNIPPEIAHTPPGTSADTAGPYTIMATVTDNVGVNPSTVSLIYNKNGGANQTLAMTNTSGDEYAASIPGPAVVGDRFNYYIIARDIATVPNQGRSPASGNHTLDIVDFFVWDFETDDGGFSATGPDWEWGSPTNGPGGANSGVNVWATKLGGNYSASSNSKLDSPPVAIPSGSTYAQLSLWMWYDTELNYDGMNVKLSTDGGASWTILTPDIGYNATATSGNAGIAGEKCFSGHGQKFWQKAIFDLTPYKGQTAIVRLHFGSDSSVQYPGFYVDDVRIEGIEDTAGPEFVARSIPVSTFDETGPYTAKAKVVDALSGVAAVSMYYSTDDGATYTAVAMTPTGVATEYGGDIPGQPSGTRIKVYFEATDNSANASLDPAGAPATTWSFGIMPSGDYLVIVGGTAETSPQIFQEAFATLGRTYDLWDWDVSGVPTQAVLNAYQAIIVDESSYFDAAQIAALTTFLATDDGTRQQIFMMGRDLSWGSSARPFMEQHTGAAYVQDNPAWYQLTGETGDPIGAGETFVISGSYPDELKFSTTTTGASAVYRYTGTGSASDRWDTEQENRAFYQKEGKEWDPKMWPFAPIGPDHLAGVRFVGTTHSAVYFSFNLYYIQEPARRAAVLGRALDWLSSTATMTVAAGGLTTGAPETPVLPMELSLDQNYPNPFNPVTQMRIGIPDKYNAPVSLRIYNVRGQLVKTVFEGVKPAGYHTFRWDGTDQHGAPVATGVYFANLVSNDRRFTRKMVLLK